MKEIVMCHYPYWDLGWGRSDFDGFIEVDWDSIETIETAENTWFFELNADYGVQLGQIMNQ